MITATIKQVRDPEWNEVDPDGISRHCVYIVRAPDAVLYVGQGQCAECRIVEHVQGGMRANSALHELFHEHRTEAEGWLVDFMTLADCLPHVEQYRPEIIRWYREMAARGIYDRNAALDAEYAMIRHHRPCLNVMGNVSATPLPDRFTRPGSSGLYLAI